MSKFMMIAGLILAAVGIALGVMVFFSPGKTMAFGISPDVAATLLVGGILAIGLGGVIAALGGGHAHGHEHGPAEMPAASMASAAMATAAAAADSAADTGKATTAEAVAALEKAKTDIAEALGLPAPEAVEEPAAVAVDEPAPHHEDGELFVVEERDVRGKQARILSDGTVEAETDEGWMRFENMEHLDEYLEAMEPAARG